MPRCPACDNSIYCPVCNEGGSQHVEEFSTSREEWEVFADATVATVFSQGVAAFMGVMGMAAAIHARLYVAPPRNIPNATMHMCPFCEAKWCSFPLRL